MSTSIPVTNRIAGGALRRYREALGLGLADAAEILECDRSKVSRIETGQRGIRRTELLTFLDEYGASKEARETLAGIAGARKPWSRALSVPRALTDLAVLLTCAARITNYESQQIPLILQTEPYTRLLADADRALDARTRTELPARLADLRRTVLQPGRAAIRFIVGEAALCRTGEDTVMRDQFSQLDPHADAPELRILPLGAGPHPGMWASSMTLLEFAGAREIPSAVHLGGPAGGVFLTDEPSVTSCSRLLSELRGMSLTGEPAARLIRERINRQ